MTFTPKPEAQSVAPAVAAPQQRPRPLPLFLDLVRSQTARQPERMAAALAGLRLYQEAERPPGPEPMPIVARAHGAVLRDYGGDGPPVIFVPSLINPPSVLDLNPGRSLLRWLAGLNQRRVMLLDWGDDAAGRREFSVSGHVSDIILPLIASLDVPPALVGYCLGGTMALAAAGLAKVERVAAIAAPWHFSGFPESARRDLCRMWESAEGLVAALGVLPMEVLQTGFWNLDPVRTVGKFESLAALPEGSGKLRAFVTLEDWANDGPPLPGAAAAELFECFIGKDLPGRGAWSIRGVAMSPERLTIPFLNILSTNDRIVPQASAARGGKRIDLPLGHVGMVVGSRAHEALWEPLAGWLSPSNPNC